MVLCLVFKQNARFLLDRRKRTFTHAYVIIELHKRTNTNLNLHCIGIFFHHFIFRIDLKISASHYLKAKEEKWIAHANLEFPNNQLIKLQKPLPFLRVRLSSVTLLTPIFNFPCNLLKTHKSSKSAKY